MLIPSSFFSLLSNLPGIISRKVLNRTVLKWVHHCCTFSVFFIRSVERVLLLKHGMGLHAHLPACQIVTYAHGIFAAAGNNSKAFAISKLCWVGKTYDISIEAGEGHNPRSTNLRKYLARNKI